ncbi:MAG: hypothetical protein LBC02_07730 [Planctomycetaceae bacterium]|jgi:hypothetical protein|nr:hypothetical protein [Planctomycetaceae bacterium]
MKTVKLNLMLTYPVSWSEWQVLRDIVQNFYDDIGYKSFGKKFSYEYQEKSKNRGTLIFSMESTGFHYEWLVHIGATTKQESRGKYAGFYGEGFKVAALCGLRDFSWAISVRSRDWFLRVTTIDTVIDGKSLKQLAYNIEEGKGHSDKTIITIDNFKAKDIPIVDAAIQNFYYPENPLLGELIYQDFNGAIYRRSELKKPEVFPESFQCGGNGIVFLSYQVRGSFVAPIVLCSHHFKTNDRDRKIVGRGTIQDVIIDLSYEIAPEAAEFLLESLKKYWYDYPDSQEDVESWYAVVRKLILRMRHDSNITKIFCEQNPNLVVCPKPTNKFDEIRKKQALEWKKTYLSQMTLVQENFGLLGYKNIIDLCEKAGGFNVTRKPTPKEEGALDILKSAAMEVLHDFVYDFPLSLVIDNDSSVYAGTAITTPNKIKKVNSKGYKVKYQITRIEIKRNLLRGDCFMDAFATYCHELCHCFGGDASQPFSLALTDVMALMIQKSITIDKYRKQWEKYFAEK